MTMKRRLQVFSGALIFAAGAFWLNAMSLPVPALACSCVPPPSLADLARDGRVIVVGTIVETGGGRGDLDVDTVFTGSLGLGHVTIRGIGSHTDACQEAAGEGERWLFSLYRYRGSFHTDGCTLNGRIGTSTGDALLAEAISTFGGGPTKTMPPTSTDSDIGSRTAAAGWPVWLPTALSLGLGSVMFVIVFVRRRPSDI
jgi:hypothetical protein